MKVALQIPHFYSCDPGRIGPWITDVAVAADEAGFQSIWFMDHLFQLGDPEWLGPVDGPMLEGFSALGYVAAKTRNLEMGLLVSPPTYRPAGLLMKTVTTLDVLSEGRMWLGLGAGWYEEEAQGLGLPFPARRARYEILEETLRLARHVADGSDAPFVEKHLRLERPLLRPSAIRQPRVPVLIGGDGPRETLRLVALYADACNLSGTYNADIAEISASLEILRRHCDHVGRSYETITRTVLDTFDVADARGLDDMIARCRTMASIGIQSVIFNIRHAFDGRAIARIGTSVLPAVAEL